MLAVSFLILVRLAELGLKVLYRGDVLIVRRLGIETDLLVRPSVYLARLFRALHCFVMPNATEPWEGVACISWHIWIDRGILTAVCIRLLFRVEPVC